MNKKSFIKIVSFFLSIPCLDNSDIFAMKQSQLHSQLDQIPSDLEKASGSILNFFLNVNGGYIDRYLKDNTIKYVCKYGWLSDFKLADPKENLSRYIEFNSFLDEDNVMTLKINFYPKTGRVMVRKIVKPLAQIQEKNKDLYWPRNTQYNVSDYKISRTACFFNCYLVSKSKENIALTQLFKELRETIDNCDREVEKIYDLSKQYNANFNSLTECYNIARNLNLSFVYNQNIYNRYDNILIDNNLNIKKLNALSYNDHVTPLGKEIKNTSKVGVFELTFRDDSIIKNSTSKNIGSNLNNNKSLDYDTSSCIDNELGKTNSVINSIKNKNNSDFKNTKNNYIDLSNLTFKGNDFKGNGGENDKTYLSDYSDDNIRGLNENPFNPNYNVNTNTYNNNLIYEEINEDQTAINENGNNN